MNTSAPINGFQAESNPQEVERFQAMLEGVISKRGPEGAVVTSLSMLAAVADVLSYGLGPDMAEFLMGNAMAGAFAEQRKKRGN